MISRRNHVVFVSAALSGILIQGCGGKVSDPPKLSGVDYTCFGHLLDGKGNDIATYPAGPPAPSEAGFEVILCSHITNPQTPADSDEIANSCTDKCNSQLQGYLTSLPANERPEWSGCKNNTPDPSDGDGTAFLSKGDSCQPGSTIFMRGGPAQYRVLASTSFNVSVDFPDPLGTGHGSSSGSGIVDVSVFPSTGPCPAGGCTFVMSNFAVDAANFTMHNPTFVADTDVSNVHVFNEGTFSGTMQDDGTFSIPAPTGIFIVNAALDGNPASIAVASGPLSGSFDRATGTLTVGGPTFNQGETTVSLGTISGTTVGRPPVPVIAPQGPIECNQPGAASFTLDASGSTDPDGDLQGFSWQVDDVPSGRGTTLAVTLPLGAHPISLIAEDQRLATAAVHQSISVVDTTAPTFDTLPPVTSSLCAPGAQAATVTVPTVHDVCTPNIVPVGHVISSNGVTLASPIPVNNGQVTLSVGTHVIEWVATDASGNQTKTTQTIAVRPAFYASDGVQIDDRAQLVTPSGAPVAIGNSGSGQVGVGVTANVGDISSVGPVFLRDRSIVRGFVHTSSTITTQNNVQVSGDRQQHVPVNLPPPTSLTGVTFPPSTTDILLDPGSGPLSASPAPGSYRNVAVKTGTTLRLRAGTYFMNSLDLEPSGALILDKSSGPIELFLKTQLIFRGNVSQATPSTHHFTFGYTGTQTLFLERPWPFGTLIAPNAAVVIGSNGAASFAGQLFAKDVEVQPDAVFTCTSDALGVTSGGIDVNTQAFAPKGDENTPLRVAADDRDDSGGCSVSAPGKPAGRLASLFLFAAAGLFIRRLRRRS